MSDALLIRGAAVVTSTGVRAGQDILIEGELIAAVERGIDARRAVRLEAGGLMAAAGFVDIHVHGVAGALFEDASVTAGADILRALAERGTTGVLATLATLPPEQLRAAVTAIATLRGRENGARILGIHLEGPFLNPSRCGAQNPDWMRPPSLTEVEALQQLSGGLIRMVTVAPELDGALPFVRALCERGIIVAIGHTEATEAQMLAAVAAGASHVTHAYNAMRPLHHREPGPVGVGLSEDRLSIELICDGHHVSPRAIDIALRCKPRERFVLISDAVMAGARDGEYTFGGASCLVRDGVVRRTNGGQLAGSCLMIDQAVRNLHAWQPALPLHHLLAFANQAPARAAGLASTVGLIQPGCRADVVLLTGELDLAAVVCGGRVLWTDTPVMPE